MAFTLFLAFLITVIGGMLGFYLDIIKKISFPVLFYLLGYFVGVVSMVLVILALFKH